MMSAPTASEDVVSATFPVLSSVPPRITTPPLDRLTFPVGTGPAPAAEIVTRKVTGCPTWLGLTELLRVTDGWAWLTIWFSMAEAPPTKLLLPPYTAVIECVPGLLKLAVIVALREEFTEATPRVLAPSAKIPEPDGVPVTANRGTTVAVRVTG